MSEPFISDMWASIAKETLESIETARNSIRENDLETALSNLELADRRLRDALERWESSR